MQIDDADTNEAKSQLWLPPVRLYRTTLDTLHDPFIGGGKGLTKRQLAMNHICEYQLREIVSQIPR